MIEGPGTGDHAGKAVGYLPGWPPSRTYAQREMRIPEERVLPESEGANGSAPRTWPASIVAAVIIMAGILAVAVGVNLLIPGRVMHWDIVAIIGGVGLPTVSIAWRYRVI